MEQGWCGPPVCSTHDGVPMSDDEADEMAECDICIHVIRLYSDAATRDSVESDHSPSQWRKREVGA